MLLNGRYYEKYAPSKRFQVRGMYQGRAFALTLSALNAQDALEQARAQYQGAEITSVHVVEKEV